MCVHIYSATSSAVLYLKAVTSIDILLLGRLAVTSLGSSTCPLRSEQEEAQHPVSTMWKCRPCQLWNWTYRQHCRACGEAVTLVRETAGSEQAFTLQERKELTEANMRALLQEKQLRDQQEDSQQIANARFQKDVELAIQLSMAHFPGEETSAVDEHTMQVQRQQLAREQAAERAEEKQALKKALKESKTAAPKEAAPEEASRCSGPPQRGC